MKPLEDIAEWLSDGNKKCPSNIAEKDEEWEDVRKAISRLSLGQRVVVVLYYINDLPLQEISEVLDMPVGTVKSRLYYGRKALKGHLETTGGKIQEVQYEFT